MHVELLVSFIVYLVAILLIGLVSSYYACHNAPASMQTANSSDFLLGGRSTHWFLTALSAHAADMSDWLFMAFPAAVYLHGGHSLWIGISLLCGMFASWHFVAARLRTQSERYHGVTLASFLSNRFADTSGIFSLLAAVISLFFLVIYIGAGLKGMGFVLESTFQLDYHVGIVASMAVVVLYTCLGGFSSVAILDLFQGLFLLAMILIVPLCAYFQVGGLSNILHAATIRNVSLAPISQFDFYHVASIVLDPLAWGLGYFGMPHILTKFMGTKDATELHKAKYVGIAWQFLTLASAALVGIVGLAYFVHGVPGKPELIFIAMTQSLFTPWLAGIVLCAVVAATISTVDTQMLVVAGIITQDIYKMFFHRDASSQKLLTIYRIALFGAAMGGLAIAWHEGSTIMALVKYGWGGLGASFGPVILLALYSTTINRYGAIAAMLAGFLTTMMWDFIAPFIISMTIYSILPAFIMSFVAAYVVSWITATKADNSVIID